MPKLNSCKFARIRTRPTFRDVTTGFPSKCRLQNECRNSIPMTCHYPHLGSVSDWFKQISSTHDQSERVIPRTLFRRETSGGVAKCRLFLRLKLCSHLIKLKAIRGFFADWQVQQSHQQRKRRGEIGWKQGKKEKLKKWKVCIFTFYIGHFKGKNMTD